MAKLLERVKLELREASRSETDIPDAIKKRNSVVRRYLGNAICGCPAGNLTLASSSTLAAEIDYTLNTADKTVVTGAVDVTGANLVLIITNPTTATGSYTQSFALIDNDSADAVTGSFAGLTRGGANDSAIYSNGDLLATIYYSFDAGTLATTGGNDVGVVFTSVPEPTSMGLLGLGTVGLLGRRRRRRSA